MSTLATQLTRALQAANVPIEGVSIGSDADRSTWRIVYAATATAQQRSDGETLRLSFDPSGDLPTFASAQLAGEIKEALDRDRLISAVVWTILDTYSAPATIAKYTAARTKIINSYSLQPWKP